MRPGLTRLFVQLALLWAVVGGAMWTIQSRQPNAQKVVVFVTANPLDGKSEAERKAVIESIASQVNGLDSDQRLLVHPGRGNDTMRAFWKGLTIPEKTLYFDSIAPKGTIQMIERFSLLPPDRRKREVDRALRNLRNRADEESVPEINPALVNVFVEAGLKTFLSGSNVDAKMNALPFIEEIEKSLRWRR